MGGGEVHPNHGKRCRGRLRSFFWGQDSNHFGFVACKACARGDFETVAEELPSVSLAKEVPRIADVTLPTDDWPYVFFRERALPVSYLVLLSLLIVTAILPLRLAYKELFDVH